MAEPRVAQLLEVPEGSPLLYVEAVSRDRTTAPSSATAPGTGPTARGSRSGWCRNE